MKYLCLAYYDEQAFEALPKPEFDAIVSQCPQYDAALRASGHLVVQASLGPPRATTTVRPRNGKPSVTDGPYIETKEHMGGFWILEAADMDEALAWARKGAITCDAAGEVRELLFFPAPEQGPGESK